MNESACRMIIGMVKKKIAPPSVDARRFVQTFVPCGLRPWEDHRRHRVRKIILKKKRKKRQSKNAARPLNAVSIIGIRERTGNFRSSHMTGRSTSDLSHVR